MNYLIKAPERLNDDILLPASKSISNRILILNSLCRCPKEIKNISVCDDTEVMIKALNDGGRNIDVGAAGTAMRFLTAFLSVKNGSWTITGTERMKNRPIKLLVDALRSLDAKIEYAEKEGFPPLRIDGRTLPGGAVSLDGGVSSQYISALLMIAPLMTNGMRLHLTGNVISRSYINLTVQLMRTFGVCIFEEGQTFTIPPQQYAAAENFTVEPDWSAASYWYAMIALCKNEDARISLPGLSPDSLQGDAAITALFDKLGVKTTFTSSGVTLTKKKTEVDDALLTFDFISMPDIVQTAAVTCAMLDIPFRFYGLQSLIIKETNRLEALQTELRKFGYPVTVYDDNTLEWNGKRSRTIPSPVVATYEDHRMAMAFAPISMRRPDGIHISDPEVVSKSYPSYWDDLKKAGFSITNNY
ncbi:MAG: 3-phosphoshikimate 1-carboxyvinyltransferase [Tannerella sp.]|nr:3-phosphoshikimate 1-carboxyvinyltransferase [Tannerella sp.]